MYAFASQLSSSPIPSPRLLQPSHLLPLSNLTSTGLLYICIRMSVCIYVCVYVEFFFFDTRAHYFASCVVSVDFFSSLFSILTIFTAFNVLFFFAFFVRQGRRASCCCCCCCQACCCLSDAMLRRLLLLSAAATFFSFQFVAWLRFYVWRRGCRYLYTHLWLPSQIDVGVCVCLYILELVFERGIWICVYCRHYE